jgi:hypothetical protein
MNIDSTHLQQRLLDALLLLLLFYLLVLQLIEIWPFTIDDMYITLRYAKNWANGNGIVWNIGESPVEGYSNFSFLVLARVALSIGLDPVLLLKIFGVTGLLATLSSLYAITRNWVSKHLALIPCFWLLAYKGQIIWTVSGLETTCFEALITTAVFFIFEDLKLTKSQNSPSLHRSRFVLAGMLLSFASLSRPEGPALMGIFTLLLLLQRQKIQAANFWQCLGLFCFAFAIFFIPYFLWRIYYFGHLFPNPVYCKTLSFDNLWTLDINYLKLTWPFLLLCLPAVVTQKHDPRPAFLWLPSLLYLILLVGADPIVAFNNRLFLPAFALLLPLALVSLIQILNNAFPSYRNIVPWGTYICSFLIALFFIPMLSLEQLSQFTKNPLQGMLLRKEVTKWLMLNTSPNATVLLADSGLIPYQSPAKFIDSYCLNNAKMAQSPNKTRYQQFCETAFAEKPDVIILTSLIEGGTAQYTPADACLAQKLPNHSDYSLALSIKTGKLNSFYRYEIFKAKKSYEHF